MRTTKSLSLYVIVFTVGAVSLGIEIAAARLIAPFFGASTIVWANTIAVVLVALSLGYWLGGRFADQHPAKEGLAVVCLIAAAVLAIVPFVATPFLDISMDALDKISAGAFIGSLLAVSALVAAPIVLLGAAAPYAIRLALTDLDQSGSIAGRMYSISTVGSLGGTFLSALLFIPLIGTRRTFLVFALALALVAVPWTRRRYLLVPFLILVALLLPVGLIKDTSDGRVIYEAETPYQYMRVVEGSNSRSLELNEGHAVHSYYRFGSYLTDDVWDGFLVMPFLTLKKPPGQIAILGNGAGTVARAYGHYFPGTRVDAVEIDPELTKVGRRYFDMRNNKMRVFHEDARQFLKSSSERYQMIAIDAYRQPYIPFYLATREFFKLVKDHLSADGVVTINVGHPEGDRKLEQALSATLGQEFEHLKRYPTEPTNTLLVASRRSLNRQNLKETVSSLPQEIKPEIDEVNRKLGPALIGGEIFTDDRAPVEWLIDRSIVEFAARDSN